MNCNELLEILKYKYKQISEELEADLLNTFLHKGYIDINKYDLNDVIINSKNCTFNTVIAEVQYTAKILLNAPYIKKAKNIMVIIIHNENLALNKIIEIMNFIAENINSKTKVIMGDCVDNALKSQIKLISLIFE